MPETKIFLELQEGLPKKIPEQQLDELMARAIFRTGEFDFQFPTFANERHYILTSKDLIGHIPVGHNCAVQIKPKVPVLNLFHMLEVAYDLQSFRLFDGVVHVEDVADLFERLASILVKRIMLRLRKGLFQDYISHQEDLSFLRGRLLVKTARMRYEGKTTVHCEYQEHTADLIDNQILLWTLRVLSATQISKQDLHFKIRQAYRLLSNTITLTPISGEMCSGRRYHRLNHDYQAMHGICKFFLTHTGPGINTGKSEMIPFLVNMPRLFEAFVAKWLQANMPSDYHVKPQFVAKLKSSDPMSWTIDLVIREAKTGKALAILDTKYKGTEALNEGDIQQVVAYAVEMGVDKAFLIYPSIKTKNTQVQVGHVSVEGLSFDIGKNINQAGCELRETLLTRFS